MTNFGAGTYFELSTTRTRQLDATSRCPPYKGSFKHVYSRIVEEKL